MVVLLYLDSNNMYLISHALYLSGHVLYCIEECSKKYVNLYFTRDSTTLLMMNLPFNYHET